ncbi:polyprenyl synthetase family protein [Streptomyces sp. AK02-01A]|uniref:polyprenyl synthetase family protein n=1 Tax=Streptomyces sp. AK02-01A TaxID=3028648 RepID=UPI0029B93C39|nr:polyprenyl synthetase family protein [Streptomyces sp. AK02-01A]MDX3850976.1 polyprenyl synthetase family protein [Streptomyces sp. AK02-01A]
MTHSDAHEAYELLLEQQRRLGPVVRSAVSAACAGAPALERSVLALLEVDTSSASPFRLLAMSVHGALTGDPEPALPVCVLSRLWWAGAEVLDDVMDGQFDPRAAGMSTAAVTVASTACLAPLPQEVIAGMGLSSSVGASFARELNRTTIEAADGQLADVTQDTASDFWKRTMTGYVGKTGAPYGRDAAMAALLAGRTEEEVRGWRAFGRLFGVLRQTANDRAPLTAELDTDLANGTPTLLRAYALETLPPAEAEALGRAHSDAMRDARARSAVWERLRRPDVAVGYDRRIAGLRHRLSVLLHQLAPPSPHRDVIQWMVNVSAESSQLRNQDGVAA